MEVIVGIATFVFVGFLARKKIFATSKKEILVQMPPEEMNVGLVMTNKGLAEAWKDKQPSRAPAEPSIKLTPTKKEK